MPVRSDREIALKKLDGIIRELAQILFYHPALPLFFSLVELRKTIESRRYWDRHPTETRNHRPYFMHHPMNVLMHRGTWHKYYFRMSASELDRLVDIFGNDDEFKATGTKPMAPARYQISLLAYRLAHGRDLKGIAGLYGISVGSVHEWTDRVLRAFLRQRNRFIVWPDQQRREQIKESFLDDYEIPDCVGIIDGFHANLSQAPSRPDAGAFHSRKERYGFNVIGIIDDRLRFTYIHYGYPASSSDQRVQRSIHPLNAPEDYFDPGEYLLADSGFTCQAQIIPLFKKPAGNIVHTGRKAFFNTEAAVMRVNVEHAIGVLKGRWQALRSMRLSLRSEKDEARAHAFIVAAVMLHNLCILTWKDYMDNTDIQRVRQEDIAGTGRAEDGEDETVHPQYRRREMLVDEMARIRGVTDFNTHVYTTDSY